MDNCHHVLFNSLFCTEMLLSTDVPKCVLLFIKSPQNSSKKHSQAELFWTTNIISLVDNVEWLGVITLTADYQLGLLLGGHTHTHINSQKFFRLHHGLKPHYFKRTSFSSVKR